jgi:hypothetical protein
MMLYRTLGSTGKKISALSFGCMRYHENEEAGVAAIRRAVELGVNFFETAINYGAKNEKEYIGGNSELILGRGLKGLRDKVYISSKCPPEAEAYNNADGARRAVDISLKKLGIDKIDFYNLWSVNSWAGFEKAIAKGGTLEGIQRARAEGLVAHIGFTTHAKPEEVVKMMETGLMENVTVSFNLLQRAYEKIPSRAQELGLGVIVMNPLAGGMFSETADLLQAKLNQGKASLVEVGLRFVLSHLPVTTALSGMRTVAEVEENVRITNENRLFSAAEMAHLNAVAADFKKKEETLCTTCGYCQPCPQEVNIPFIMRSHNLQTLYGFKAQAKNDYNVIGKLPWIKGKKADACTECGECEPKCPNKLDIIQRLKQCREWFGD